MSLSYLTKALQSRPLTKAMFKELWLELSSFPPAECKDWLHTMIDGKPVHEILLAAFLKDKDRLSWMDSELDEKGKQAVLMVVLELLSHASKEEIEEEIRQMMTNSNILPLLKTLDFKELIERLLKGPQTSATPWVLWNEFFAAVECYFLDQQIELPPIFPDYFFYQDIKREFSSVIPADVFHVKGSFSEWRKDLCQWLASKLLENKWSDSTKIIDLLNRLTVTEQKEILRQTDSEGWNALMLAACYQPEAVEPLLAAIKGFAKEEQLLLLKQTESKGWNALMLAARYQPEAVEPLLKAIKGLAKEEQLLFLKQATSKGWNALMLAARNHPKAVVPLLETLKGLAKEEQRLLLKQKAPAGNNSLLLALRWQPAAALAIWKQMDALNIAPSLDSSDQQILQALINKEIDKHKAFAAQIEEPLAVLCRGFLPEDGFVMRVKNPGLSFIRDLFWLMSIVVHRAPDAVLTIYNQLPEAQQRQFLEFAAPGFIAKIAEKGSIFLAEWLDSAPVSKEKKAAFLRGTLIDAAKSPEAVACLLAVIQNLGQEELLLALKQTKFCGSNALTEAALYQPAAVTYLLEAIKGLDKEEQVLILKHTIEGGDNALMCAAYSNPAAVTNLLEAIKGLDKEEQVLILKQTTKNGKNALMYAAYFKPAAVVPLLDAIQDLDEKEQLLILKQTDSDGWNALMLAVWYQPTAVAPLLASIQSLNKKERFHILKQTAGKLNSHLNGTNVLMLAVPWRLEAVPLLLKVIQDLDEEDQRVILQSVDAKGRNLLIKAAHYEPASVGVLLECFKQFSKEMQAALIMQENAAEWDLLFKAAANPRAQCYVRMFQFQERAGKDAQHTRWAHAAEALYEGMALLFKDEAAWPQWPALLREAREDFKRHGAMMKLIDALEQDMKQHQRITRNRRQYERFVSYFELEKEGLSMDEQYARLNPSSGQPPLADCFLTVRHSPSIDEAKEKIKVVYDLIKTFSPEQERQILQQSMARLSDEEQSQLQEWLDDLDQDEINRQIKALSDEKNELIPSAPPLEVLALEDELLPMAQATEPQEVNKAVWVDAITIKEPVIAVNAVIDEASMEEALAAEGMMPAEWEAQLLRFPKETIKELAALSHEEQQSIMQHLEKKAATQHRLTTAFNHDPLSQRYFLLVQLGAAPISQPKARDYLYTQLQTLIAIEERTSAPEKQQQISQLWHDFIGRCRLGIEKEGPLCTRFTGVPDFFNRLNQPVNILDELLKIQQHPQFNPVIEKEHQNVHVLPSVPVKPVALYSDRGEKALFLAIQQNSNKEEVKNILAENYQKHLQYQEGPHNVLTLMFSKKHPALPWVIPYIKTLPNVERQTVLNFYTAKNCTLLEPRSYVNQAFKSDRAAKQYLYVLELERIVLTMKETDPAKETLKCLHETLAAMDSIEGNVSLQQKWYKEIRKTREMPEVKQKQGLVNWFKNALGFAKAENIKGYGIGLFKPSVDSLLDDMENLSKEQYAKPRK